MSAHGGHYESSTRARALSERLQAVIAESRLHDAKLTDADIDGALRLVTPARPGAARKEGAVAIAIVAALLAAILGVGLTVARKASDGAAPALAWVLVGVLVLVVAGAVVVYRDTD